jgi:preprotein translocase subunit SecG
MITLVTVIHVIVSLGLVVIVLLQTGKGADIGAVFGGSSSTIFGSSGAGNFLTRLTTGLAVVFMITSLTLGYFSGKRPSSSVLDRAPNPAQQSLPPAGSAPGEAGSDAKSGETNPQPEKPPAQKPSAP